ncbi:ATP-binding protein [Flavobacteriaceae bacterium M23B6Z8]
MKKYYFYIIFLTLLSSGIFKSCNLTNTTKNKKPPSKAALHLQKIKKLKDTLNPKDLLVLIDKGISIASKKDSLYLVFLDYKIFYSNKLEKYDSSLSSADQLIKYAERQKDTKFIAKGYYRKSIISKILKQQKTAFKYASEAKKWSLLIKDSLQVGRRLKEMAIIQEQFGDFVGCQSTATEALKYLRPLNEPRLLFGAHNAIAISYRKQYLFENALAEYRNALSYAPTKIDSLRVLNNMTVSYREQKDYRTSIEILSNIIKEKELKKEPDLLAKVIDNLAHSKWLLDHRLNVLPELMKALELRFSEDDLEGLQASYEHLADYFSVKDKSKEIAYVKKHLEVAEKFANTDDQLQTLSRLVDLLPLRESALYAKKYVKLADSIRKQRIRDIEYFSKIKYDNSLVQEENLELKTKNTQTRLRLVEEKHKNLRTAAGAILFLFAGIGSTWFLIVRSKKEKVKEVYRTENRISQKVHDEIANGIYQVMTVIQQKDENIRLVDKLDDVYTKARNISRETGIINTGKEYPEELKALLESYVSNQVRLTITGMDRISWKNIHELKKQVVYRVLQELMTNMKKHSQATHVFIRFSSEGRKLKIFYSDNGIGFPKTGIVASNGLLIAETRIQSINGTLNFETNQGKGLKAFMNFPI